MILDLPFAFEINFLPSRKHKKPRSVGLRGYTLVKIPELALVDVDEAMVIKSAGRNARTEAWTKIYSYGDRLIGPVLSERGQITGADLQAAVGADRKYEIWTRDIPAVVGKLPHPTVRTDRRVSPAMSRHTFERQMQIYGFVDPQPVDSNEELRRGEAQGYYSQAVVLLDGVLYVEVPEPVWRVRKHDESVFVELEMAPTMMAASRLFRLDQYDRARNFARRLGRLEADDGETCLTFLRPGEVNRIDVDEIAKVAVAHQHALYGLTSRIPGEPRYDWRKFVENRFILSSENHPRGDAAVAILDKLEKLWGRIEGAGPDLASSSYASMLAEIVERWRFESENDVLEPFDDMTEEDLAALADLSSEFAGSPAHAINA